MLCPWCLSFLPHHSWCGYTVFCCWQLLWLAVYCSFKIKRIWNQQSPKGPCSVLKVRFSYVNNFVMWCFERSPVIICVINQSVNFSQFNIFLIHFFLHVLMNWLLNWKWFDSVCMTVLINLKSFGDLDFDRLPIHRNWSVYASNFNFTFFQSVCCQILPASSILW